ncbi:hypothetical protein [Streptomyces violascens]|uniref:hypothetical protein n=1 Tax=Streptomyces violascens TaxID=67381 RepID=UPI0036953951
MDAELLSVQRDPGPYADELRVVGYRVDHEPAEWLSKESWELFRQVQAGRYDTVHR